MNRNVESHFATLPKADIKRSRMDLSHSVKFSFNVGDIIPFMCEDVLPGDTFSIDTSKVVRMQTLIAPIMDNVYLDTYYFFVPNRLVWSHWRELMGENTESAWIPETEYSEPQLVAPAGGWQIGSIADYLGVPPLVEGISVSALPFRGLAMIMNEWFRDENLTDPLNITISDATQTGSNGDNYITDVELGGKPFKAGKYRDYFTSCLPSPLKGEDVRIPVGSGLKYPVMALNEEIPNPWNYYAVTRADSGYSNWDPRHPTATDGSSTFDATVKEQGTWTAGSASYGYKHEISNLWAIGDGSVAGATINQLRMAFQIQKLYEKDARGGTRYIELLKSHFGVTSPDSRLQRPEYLGGNRIPISINQVIQNSASTKDEYLGDLGAMSVTSDYHSDFTHSFTEHGYVFGVCVARYDHTYQQGIPRKFSRKSRFDYYWPVFANIGEQAVKVKEIYATGTQTDNDVFGYQEAWAEYRYQPNRVAGEMRSVAPTSLDVWHLGDDYTSQPFLSDAWIREDKSNVDRVLRVTSSLANQLFADFYIKNHATRPMPVYSIPGLIDHH